MKIFDIFNVFKKKEQKTNIEPEEEQKNIEPEEEQKNIEEPEDINKYANAKPSGTSGSSGRELRKFEIIIFLKDGSTEKFYKTCSKTKETRVVTPIIAFYDFFKWFYLRNSPYYTYKFIQTDNNKLPGMTIFIRKEIKKISMFETIIYEDGGVH
jgi:hypothetical protein